MGGWAFLQPSNGENSESDESPSESEYEESESAESEEESEEDVEPEAEERHLAQMRKMHQIGVSLEEAAEAGKLHDHILFLFI